VSRVSDRTTYVLPVRSAQPLPAELLDHVRELADHVPVVVVDGSEPEVFARNAARLAPGIVHVAPRRRTANGKVGSVVTGVTLARTPYVVIADDDVRYDVATLGRVVDLLAEADAVMPQNFFEPSPWHASWDTGRVLLNRALGHDYAGTLAVRRDAFLASGCYCGEVLFENLELMRTLEAHGCRVRHAPDVLVARRPPTTAQFLRQRLRQAYDSRAQPVRMLAELAILPALVAARRSPRTLATLAGLVVAVAEVGRRRAGGTAVWPVTTSLWAVPWALERAVTSWGAVVSGLRGGARYRDGRLRVAAHRVDDLAKGTACSCERHDVPVTRPPTAPTERPAAPAAPAASAASAAAPAAQAQPRVAALR
jgi:hypothetical protein